MTAPGQHESNSACYPNVCFVVEGYDPPEGWGWCYIDEVILDLSHRATPHNDPIPRYF